MSRPQAYSNHKGPGQPPAAPRADQSDQSVQPSRSAADRPAWGRAPAVQENTYAARLRLASQAAAGQQAAASSTGQSSSSSSANNESSRSSGSLLSLGTIPQKPANAATQRTGPSALQSAGANRPNNDQAAHQPSAATAAAAPADSPAPGPESLTDGAATAATGQQASPQLGLPDAPGSSSSQTDSGPGTAWQNKGKQAANPRPAANPPSGQSSQAHASHDKPKSTSDNSTQQAWKTNQHPKQVQQHTSTDGAGSSSASHGPSQAGPIQHSPKLTVSTTPAANSYQQPLPHTSAPHASLSSSHPAVAVPSTGNAASSGNHAVPSITVQTAVIAAAPDQQGGSSSSQASASGATQASHPAAATRRAPAPVAAWGRGTRSFATVLAGSTAAQAARAPQASQAAPINTTAAHQTDDAPTSSRSQGNAWRQQRQPSTSGPPAQPSTPQPAPRPLHHPARNHGPSSAGSSGSAGPSFRAVPPLYAPSTPVTPPATPPRDPGRPGAWPGGDVGSPAHDDPSASSTSSSSASPSHSSAWRTPLTPGTPTAAAPAPSTSQPRHQRNLQLAAPQQQGCAQRPAAAPAAAPAHPQPPAAAGAGPPGPDRPPALRAAAPAAARAAPLRPGSPPQPASPQRREPPPIQPAAVASSSHSAAAVGGNQTLPSSSTPVRLPPQHNLPSPRPGTPPLSPVTVPVPPLGSPMNSPTIRTPSPPASPSSTPASNQPSSSSAHPVTDAAAPAVAAPKPLSWAERLRTASGQPLSAPGHAPQAWQGLQRPPSSSSAASDSVSVGSHDRNPWGSSDHRSGGRGPGRGGPRGAASTSGGHGRGGRYGLDASSSSHSGRSHQPRGRAQTRGLQQHQRGRSVDSVSSDASRSSAASSSASRGAPPHGQGPARPPSQPSNLARRPTHGPDQEPSSSNQSSGAHSRGPATHPPAAGHGPPAAGHGPPAAGSAAVRGHSVQAAPATSGRAVPQQAQPASQQHAQSLSGSAARSQPHPASAPVNRRVPAGHQQPTASTHQHVTAGSSTQPRPSASSSQPQVAVAPAALPSLPPIATSAEPPAPISSTPNTPTRSPPPSHPPTSPLAPQSPRQDERSLPTSSAAGSALAERPSSSSSAPPPTTTGAAGSHAAAPQSEPLAPASPSARDVHSTTLESVFSEEHVDVSAVVVQQDVPKAQTIVVETVVETHAQQLQGESLHVGSSTSVGQVEAAVQAISNVVDPEAAEKLAELVQQLCIARSVEQVFPDARTWRLEPRGLVNTGNSCFMNATLQALLATSAFCGVLHALLQVRSHLNQAQYPTLAAMAELAAELQPPPEPAAGANGNKGSENKDKENEWKEVPRGKKGKAPLHPPAAAPPRPLQVPLSQALGGKPLVPNMMAALVPKFHPQPEAAPPAGATANGGPVTMAQKLNMIKTAPVDQEQQDAQEFLQFLLDHAHEELLQLKRQMGVGSIAEVVENSAAIPEENGTADVDEWETVGRRNKSAVTRKHELPFSLISGVFRGRLRSTVKAAGEKASATEEPFMLLHLFIAEGVRTLEEALGHFTAPETIHGYKTKAGNQVEAVKVVKIAEAPRVLVLHLLRFTWQQGNVKNMRHLVFGNHLRLTPSMLAEECPQHRTGVEYKLVATVTHRGKDTWHGHYTAHALQYNGNWLHFNDATVTNATERHVLGESTYMLVYERV